MTTIQNPIIPIQQKFARIKVAHEIDKKAICIFAATGFFLDTDTFWKDKKVLPPASENLLDNDGFLIESKPWFEWYYSPREISFDKALEEFTYLFEEIIVDQVGANKVILPLSGGLDSRTQAVALAKMKNPVSSYSYSFKGGYSESGIGKKIAQICGFDFNEFTIEPDYLWPKLEELSELNHCYSEFTHPRQMAVLKDLRGMEGVFSLGHWGDVLFDSGVPENATTKNILDITLKKILKKGGLELAIALWQEWDLGDDFESYLRERISGLLNVIKIDNTSAKLRAFKSLYWAPRWTSVNLSVFEAAHPVTLPYYDNRMCEFICSVPEEYLADRKLQIAYIKQQSPALAKQTWQDHRPFNLYNFNKNRSPRNLPYRITNRLMRELKHNLGKPYIQRNWELQFLGKENDENLQNWLFGQNLHPFISKGLRARFYNSFKTVDAVTYSHPLSILLTLAVWNKNHSDEKPD